MNLKGDENRDAQSLYVSEVTSQLALKLINP